MSGDGGPHWDEFEPMEPGRGSKRRAFYGRVSDTAAAVRRALSGATRPGAIPIYFVLGFTLLSFFGTYIGMTEVLASGDTNAGWLGDAAVFILVALLTAMMVYALSQAANPAQPPRRRVIYAATYIPLLVFSVTFGFAFYWTRLEARQQAVGDAVAVLGRFDSQLGVASANLGAALDGLTAFKTDFEQRAALEFEAGNQCGEASGGGAGPRYRHLSGRASEIGTFVNQVSPRFATLELRADAVRGRISEIRKIGDLDANDVTIVARQDLFREAVGEAREASIAITALAQNQDLREQAANFRLWASEYADEGLVRVEEGTGRRFKCFNTTAAANLRSVAATLSSLPQLEAPELDDYAGPRATREAVERVIYTFTHLFDGGADVFAVEDQRAEDAAREAFDRGRRSAVGAAPAVVGPSETDRVEAALRPGIRSDDRFSLFIAFFVDGLLFLSTFFGKPLQRFSAFRRMVDEVRAQTVTPISVVGRATGQSGQDPWWFIEPFIFTYVRDDYLAQPIRRDTPEARMLHQIVTAWKRGGLIRPAVLPQGVIRAQLKDIGAAEGRKELAEGEGPNPGRLMREMLDLADQWDPSGAAEPKPKRRLFGAPVHRRAKFRAWRFTHGSFEFMILSGLFDPERTGVRPDPSPQPPPDDGARAEDDLFEQDKADQPEDEPLPRLITERT